MQEPELYIQLKQSEEKYKIIFENKGTATGTYDDDGIILSCNAKFSELSGYDSDDIIGKKKWSDFVHKEDLDRMLAYHSRRTAANDHPPPDQYECRVINKSGEIRHVTVNIGMSGTLRIVSLIDITERVIAEQSLKNSEERFRAICNASFGGIVIHDRGIILECNESLSSITGYRYDELIGTNGLDLISDDTRQTVIRRINTNYTKPYEAKGVRKDGEIYPLRLQGKNIPYKGKIVRIVEFRDITDNKQAEAEKEELEKQLRHIQKMDSIGNLAGGIAHDFNNLLSPIIGYAELMVEDFPEDSLQYRNIKSILHAGIRGKELINQILSFSRQIENEQKPVRIQSILQDALTLSRSVIPAHINMEQDIDEDCGFIIADSTQLHQVAMNLITNAFHAVEETGGKISVSLKSTYLKSDSLESMIIEQGDYALLSISDTGCGIPKHIMDKIFEPYFTTKKSAKGTGLGLSVVYGIIKKHNGHIHVTSEAGKGASFDIYLPLLKDKTVAESTVDTAAIKRGTETILVVDDEESNVMLLQQMLKRLGYNTAGCTSGADALRLFEDKPQSFNLIITDLAMPNMTGPQLAKYIIEIRPDIPVIICSGFSDDINNHESERFGIKGFLQKPVLKSEMAGLLREVLDGAVSSPSKMGSL